ncbi:hypothetical protein [Methylobacterium sp. Gmos1]
MPDKNVGPVIAELVNLKHNIDKMRDESIRRVIYDIYRKSYQELLAVGKEKGIDIEEIYRTELERVERIRSQESDLARFYSIVILNETVDRNIYCYSFPKNGLKGNINISQIISLCEISGTIDVGAAYLPHAITAVLDFEDNLASAIPLGDDAKSILSASYRTAGKSKSFEFATRIVNQPLIPTERSPLTADSLVSLLIEGGSASAYGAKLGMAATGVVSGPALLLVVPAGIFVVVLTEEIAKALAAKIKNVMNSKN